MLSKLVVGLITMRIYACLVATLYVSWFLFNCSCWMRGSLPSAQRGFGYCV